MTSPLEQSVKEKIRMLAREREVPFSELWRTLILERFLTRLCHSSYRDSFVFKGGFLLAKYLPLGRETKDLDFFIQRLPNTQKSLIPTLSTICSIDLDDSFFFEIVNIDPLEHIHMPYTGAQIYLLAKFGRTKTHLRIDLGFGDIVQPIDHPIDLIATATGPLFESKISLRCYPKEFIFAEKLETVLFRGRGNSRMKDFHDLFSLISLGNLNEVEAEKAIQLVFDHRNTSLKGLPITLDLSAREQLGKAWSLYQRRLSSSRSPITPPLSITDLIDSVNQWISQKTLLCR